LLLGGYDSGVNSDAVLQRVRDVCMVFPGTEEKLSHGAPSFFAAGKMFISFVDDHHGDGRLAVWAKASPEKQRALVASDADVYFVPPYVGVKGWVGVRLDRPRTDWIELSMIVEEGWSSVATPALKRETGKPRPAPPPPPERKTTDLKTARAALEKLSKLCLALPEATIEREGSHATFRVGKKTFCYFLDNHHGDGIIAASYKVEPKGAHAKMARKEPKRFFLPAYIHSRGWVGERLDVAKVDWPGLRERITASWASAAPKKLAARAPRRS
jgi:hypothetical protein